MDIQLFRDLERLKRTGNFSQAAAMGNVSQSAFSRRIQALEAWVGAPLVDRSRQPVRLTASGEQILEAGLQAADRIEHARAQIQALHALPDSYVVTFGAQHSIGWRFFPAWLQALEEAYGPLVSRLRADDLPNCMADLRAGEIDLVIAYARAEPGSDRPIESILIGQDHLIPVSKPDEAGLPLHDPSLSTGPVPLLRFRAAAPISGHLAPLFEAEGLEPRLHTVYENAMAGALRLRARAGDGLAWLPKSLVQPDLESRHLVAVGPAHWVVDLSIRLYRNRGRSHPIPQAIWEFLATRQEAPLLPPP